ncbi:MULTISPECIES: gliding motility protein [Flavobacterium]|uniref:type IX secretion system periplasmic lipoprotein PorW/SprE n=1 Tax=Flavobacterium TaxID=237 RepID=UPI001FCBC07C|nr:MULTISPECIES: gliding motility protein [Flavobacterium]UOK43185.1 gliding motility protein [Flavobacterium enshiense]
MKDKKLKYLFAVSFLALLIACSTKKNTWLSRNSHALSAKDNILYNGYLAFDKGVEDVKATYKDNFWDILPVERMQEKTEAILPGESKNPNFIRAEEKATKAIQKHSMYIDGSEKNPQMDEAHLLLGKARYYDNRFIPALDAFNYILYKYSNSDKIYEAKIWREKTNIRLENDAQAIKNLKLLLKGSKLQDQLHADANAILAQAYMNTNVKDTAIAKLKIARDLTKHKEERARYNFILGQLYESLNYPDSAYAAFQEVIDMKRKSPRRYVIWAHAKQAQQFDYKSGDTLAFSEKYDDLLKDRENRPYLDVINHQKGMFYDKLGKNREAKKHYNNSLRSVSQDNYLVASNYRNLAAIYFEEAKYRMAGQYYDSTLLRLDERSREHYSVKKKRENLADVIKYEDIITNNDSILKVVAMSENERRNFYEAYISKLKIEDEKKALEAAKRAEEGQRQNQVNPQSMIQGGDNQEGLKGGKKLPVSSEPMPMQPPTMQPPTGQPPVAMGNQSSFYFYNPNTVAFGKGEFRKKWGNRTLKDNWRWASAEESTDVNEENDTLAQEVAKADEIPVIKVEKPQYSVDFYTSQLPSDQKVLDSLVKDRNFAYFQLGNIYKEKFKEYELAASRLETLLTKNPEERLVLPAKYNLYKIYEIINPSKAEAMKNDIIANYPSSHYAQILSNSAVGQITDTPEVAYGNLFKKYEQGLYQEALIEADRMIQNFAGDSMAAKFELLRARIIARLEGLDQYKNELISIAKNYPTIEEGKEADALVKNDIPKLEQMQLGKGTPVSWKIVYEIPYPNAGDAKVKALTDKLAAFIKDRNSTKIVMSNDVYLKDKSFIVIHGFASKDGAESTVSVLRDFKGYKVKEPAFVISNEDYKVVQIKKNLSEYLATIK